MIGRTFAHFRILAPLGSGGMGEVYRARDTHLERDVAIKVLPPDLLPDEDTRRRFRAEALALSGLQHPHIAVIHDFSEEHGVAYLVMELIEGESLEQRLARGPLPEPEVRRLGGQIASALAAAHARAIVHRDLKPSNVMVTARGDAKVLDFGIAKRLATPEGATASAGGTQTGALVGTLPYMAPEQLRGGALDARTDVFALGAVLYEMATGQRPFSGATAIDLADAILNREPPPPRTLRPEVTPALESVIGRCLEKDPKARFESAAAVSGALAGGLLPAPAADPRRSRARRVALVLSAVAVVAVSSSVLVSRLAGRFGAGGAVRSLAVLPLENLSVQRDEEYFAEGMTDELIVSLQSIQALKVISRSSSMAVRSAGLSAREIGRRLHVDALVTGSIQREGDRVRIRAQLVRASTDESLWADSFERDGEDVLALQSDVAKAIVERIRAKLQPAEQARLAAHDKVDQRALEHYLRGRYLYNRMTADGWRSAIVEFDKSVEIAPRYAPAYCGLADTYGMLSGEFMPADEAMTRARAFALKAVELAPGLASAYGSLGLVYATYDYDWVAAAKAFRRGYALNPHEPSVLQGYGQLLHVTGHFDEALALFRSAREQDPLSMYLAGQALWPLNQGRRYPAAVAGARSLIESDSSAWYPHLLLGQARTFSGAQAEGIAELERASRLEPSPLATAWLGWAYGLAGRTAEARGVLEQLRASARTGVVQPYCFALVLVGLGDRDGALAWLARAVDERTAEGTFIKVDPAWDPIRSDPRFIRLLAQAHLDRDPIPDRTSL